MRIVTANVNGIRAAKRKGMYQWLERQHPEVLCMQEVRAPQTEIDPIAADMQSIYAAQETQLQAPTQASTQALAQAQTQTQAQPRAQLINEVCEIKGRAGVATLSSLEIVAARYGLPGLSEPVDTGRWIETDIVTPSGEIITVVCVYVHAGNVDDPEKMMQKYRFLDQAYARMAQLRKENKATGREVVLCGDFNIAHTPLDIKRAKENETHAGFLPKERAYITQWLQELGYVDVLRSLVGEEQGPYTWWSQRGKAFDNNVGWRIDYQFATPRLASLATGWEVDRAASYAERWSDHAPVIIRYDR